MKLFPLITVAIFLTTLSLASVKASASKNRGDARERIEPKGYLYGFGLGVSHEIYKGYNYRVIPLPIIGYRGDNFSVLGPFVSYKAVDVADITLSILAAPRFQGFEDSDSYIFENMKARKFSMDAGIGLSYQKQDWKIGFSTLFDVLNRSGGYEAKANISRVFRKGPLFFEPSLSLNYLDSNNVDYYYGIKTGETNAFTTVYQGKSALNTTLGISLATPIFFGGFTRLALDYTWYDTAITDSPLVEDNTNLGVRFIFSKFF